MVSHLMPAADEAPPCSIFTKTLGVKPAGTGLSLDRVILVSVPMPWPKPALGHPWLKPAAQIVARATIPSRLFAAEPWGAGADTGESELVVELYERDGLGFDSYRWVLDDVDQIPATIQAITDADYGAHGMAPIAVTVPTFLVCTQGSHDVCCGSIGVDLADQIEQERSDYRLRRVSHTGGHRFAPTFLALPSGRMWAYADLALVDRVASGSETVDDLRMCCRGWLGAPKGAAQVAELAARIQAGNPFVEAPMISVDAGADDVVRCQVTADGLTVRVGVHQGRQVPTIACSVPGGLPVKVAHEYDWTIDRGDVV